MRILKVVLVCCAGLASTSAAMAYENYLPLGTGYSSSVDSLPSFDSETGQIIEQADVYETEIYMFGRKRVEEDSRLRSFFSDAESTGTDSQIDY